MYKNCVLCPRKCGADRAAGSTGYCGENAGLRLAFASLHHGEEPPITGHGGSGTIFVSGCSLRCAYCQNHQISQGGAGRNVSDEEFAKIALALQERGAENINIVTGTHHIPALVRAVSLSRRGGLKLPVLWNSSGYETRAAVSLLKDCVDSYLPDLKTLDGALAGRLYNAPDYPDAARESIGAMLEFAPGAVIVRHLMLPGELESTRNVIKWFAENAAGRARFSLMTQWTPVQTGRGLLPERFISRKEFDAALEWLEEAGIEDGFYQELVRDTEWLPDFSRANPFSSELSSPVWHYQTGFEE